MISPLQEAAEPYTLPSNVIFFHDWRYVNPGGYHWAGPEGESVPLFGPDPVPPMRYQYKDMPLGLELEACPGQKTGPVISASEGDILLHGGNVIFDEGRYRLWYRCCHPDPNSTDVRHYLLRYAESDNGFDWKFPNLGLIEFEGTRHNNIVYGGPHSPDPDYHNGSIFKDPSAPSSERYKAFYLGTMSREKFEGFRLTRPEEFAAFPLDKNKYFALFGAVSPDGLNWTPLGEPLILLFSDTHNICSYDEVLGKYVAFVRTRYFGRRSIGRCESKDFRRFTQPEMVFWPDAEQHAHDTWYFNQKTMMPGTIDYHLMFPTRWSMLDDRFEFCLASSPDGIVWGFVPGGPVGKPGEVGSWDAGIVEPGYGIVPLPEKRIGMMSYGSPLPHKHPRRSPLGALGWIWWPEDRLVALKAKAEASFALYPLIFKGQTVHLNFRTRPSGYVGIEVLGPDGRVLPGRHFSDCDPMTGDCLDHVVSWRGETELGHIDGSPVTLRFRLRTAELYAVRFA